jgi:hypothetical protein
MNKIILICGAIVFIFNLAACGKNEEEKGKEKEKAASTVNFKAEPMRNLKDYKQPKF